VVYFVIYNSGYAESFKVVLNAQIVKINYITIHIIPLCQRLRNCFLGWSFAYPS